MPQKHTQFLTGEINNTKNLTPTSRISNLAVLTLAQVFFSRDTELIFMPAVKEETHIRSAQDNTQVSFPAIAATLQLLIFENNSINPSKSLVSIYYSDEL